MTLVGTMHIGIEEKDMDPQLWTRLETADTVIIETDISQMDTALMSSYMVLPAGQDLPSLLGEKAWTKFLKITKESNSPVSQAQLSRLSPLAAGALLLQIQAKADEEIAAGKISIDQVIFDKGKALGKKAKTLETNQEQLESLKLVFTIKAVQEVIEDWEAEVGKYAALKEAFKRGDSVALDELLKEVPEEMRFHLLEKRNRNWVERLPSLQGENTVLAVGAAHFAGPTGLLKLLEAEGYSIQRLK